jgi:hypothetical protein
MELLHFVFYKNINDIFCVVFLDNNIYVKYFLVIIILGFYVRLKYLLNLFM